MIVYIHRYIYNNDSFDTTHCAATIADLYTNSPIVYTWWLLYIRSIKTVWYRTLCCWIYRHRLQRGFGATRGLTVGWSLDTKLVDSARQSTKYRQIDPTMCRISYSTGDCMPASNCNRYEMMPVRCFDYEQISLVEPAAISTDYTLISGCLTSCCS